MPDLDPMKLDVEAIALVRKSYTNSIDHHVVSTLLIPDGQLRIVAYEDEGEHEESYVITTSTGESTHLADINEISFYLCSQAKTTKAERILKSFSISGILAILITLAILYLSIIKEPIPEILAHSLTAILGFYFGSKVAR
jgi:hypothetical protein